MYIARILYPVKVLGPGNRIGIWFVGCHHRCKGCSNPELWKVDEKYFITIDQVEKLIRTVAAENEIDGFTITGGAGETEGKSARDDGYLCADRPTSWYFQN